MVELEAGPGAEPTVSGEEMESPMFTLRHIYDNFRKFGFPTVENLFERLTNDSENFTLGELLDARVPVSSLVIHQNALKGYSFEKLVRAGTTKPQRFSITLDDDEVTGLKSTIISNPSLLKELYKKFYPAEFSIDEFTTNYSLKMLKEMGFTLADFMKDHRRYESMIQELLEEYSIPQLRAVSFPLVLIRKHTPLQDLRSHYTAYELVM